MTTEQIVLIALAVNLVVAFTLIAASRIRFRRELAAPNGASSSRLVATGASAAITADARPSAVSVAYAGTPWFPVRPTGSASTLAQLATDRETGLALGPEWARWLAEEEARIKRFHRPATIVLVELTGLDRLADRLGDEAAQRLIPPISLTMRQNARATDHLARLGPTLFGAILTETDEIQAINYIERVRSACDVWLEAGAVMLRLSIGWAEMSPDRPTDVARPDAERRLYEERQRTWSVLSRQGEEHDVEAAVLRPAQA